MFTSECCNEEPTTERVIVRNPKGFDIYFGTRHDVRVDNLTLAQAICNPKGKLDTGQSRCGGCGEVAIFTEAKGQ